MKIVLFVLIAWALTGCATMEEWLGEDLTESLPLIGEEPPLRYSETPQAGVMQDRQYKRMTRSRMEEESELQSNAGSLWMMEGQTSYMFSQNKSRREGDTVTIKMEGPGMKQVETKANNIKALIKELEEEERRRKEGMNPQIAPMAESQEKGKDGKPAAQAARAPASAEKPKEEKVDMTDVQNIPTKIVERLPDGNFRIKGTQPFMIEKKEYKVIISGIIKPEDFNDEGVSSNKLLDPQYDVVSIRRANLNENSN